MIKKIIILGILGLVLSGCTSGKSDNNSSNTQQKQSDSIAVPVEKSDVSEGYSIRLTSPQKGQVLKSPFLVGGEANLPDNMAYVRVKKLNGDIVISEKARIKSDAGELGPFGVLLSFEFQATNKGTVEVYGIDPNTGKEVSLKSVDVNFDTSSGGSAQILN
ncbi:hypothetical protein CL632_03520 [bacterium]|jgi:hypothetical protein|nr:hypothetical protein [bacterium]MDP6571719.1 Gmad2 immunoglobulin-like domain-containing protein [Patescibacteria group bacterium]MDP6756297.1 Gmad2 immunoglobulin-like domain-containing protein [Patescibacteria group bacterium]|tara:strand:- start:3443 stop:3925 length:483 start_codon:yes stop_codon:yes gene_type:complete